MTPREISRIDDKIHSLIEDNNHPAEFSIHTSPVDTSSADNVSSLEDTSIRSADGFYKPVNYTPVFKKWHTKRKQRNRHLHKKRRYTKKHKKHPKKRRGTKKHPKKQYKHRKPYTKKHGKH
jgi:hypothetical protein